MYITYKFPKIPVPLKDESLLSFIYRLANINNHAHKWVFNLLGISIHTVGGYLMIKQETELISLEKITGISVEILKDMSIYSHFNDEKENNTTFNTIDKFAIRTIKKQFCPLCLREGLYYRKHWDLNLYTRCHTHMCLMLSDCYYCKSKLLTKNILDGQCKCGRKLSNNPYTKLKKRFIKQKMYN